jgi:hypothetical protein
MLWVFLPTAPCVRVAPDVTPIAGAVLFKKAHGVRAQERRVVGD